MLGNFADYFQLALYRLRKAKCIREKIFNYHLWHMPMKSVLEKKKMKKIDWKFLLNHIYIYIVKV